MKVFLSWALVLAPVVLAMPASNAVEARTPTSNENPTPIKAAAQSLCSQYAYWSGNGYEILNNLWGKDSASSGSQCTYYNGQAGSGVNWSSTWSWQGAENNVKSYVYAGRQITRKLVSQINRLPTSMQWSYSTTNGVRANVAYDIFTSTDKDHSNSSGDYELMIWLGRLGGVYPISQNGQPIARVNVAGYNWDLYFGYNGAMKVYSFLASNGNIQNFNADVKQFFNYLTQNQGFPASQQYMLIYQVGTEAFTSQGQVTFNCPSFSASLE